jgi:hypothetical protein
MPMQLNIHSWSGILIVSPIAAWLAIHPGRPGANPTRSEITWP